MVTFIICEPGTGDIILPTLAVSLYLFVRVLSGVANAMPGDPRCKRGPVGVNHTLHDLNNKNGAITYSIPNVDTRMKFYY